MHFAGKVWRLLVGIKDALVLVLVLAFLWAVFAVLTARPSPAAVREGALVIALDGAVVEERSLVDPISALVSQRLPAGEYRARDVVHALDAAVRDDRAKAVVLDLDRFMGGGQVHLTEIGEAMARVRKAGKPVLTYATAYTDDAMLLAAHASEVWVNPLGGAMIAGPGGQSLYYGGLLDRFKVKAHVFKVGTYKSAVEPYERSGMSDPARENAAALYGALWEEYRATLAKARPGADIAAVTRDPVALVRASGGNLALAAKRAGLVDRIGSRAQFDSRLVALVGADEFSDLPRAYAATDLDSWLAAHPGRRGGGRIAVATVAGTIVDGDAGPGSAGGDRIADLIDAALADGDLKGLVLRVDSPGGSVLASERIREAVARVRAQKVPVAVSMANVAASGGYWVATAGERIFAQPESVTGSIGVFGVVPSFEETAALYGVTSDGVRTTALSGQPDLVGGLTPEVEAIAQAGVEDSYARFLGLVAKARGMTPQAVDALAQGRVWDGGSARQVGLVDQYGGLDDALAWVAGRAKLAKGEWQPDFLGAEDPTYDSLLRRFVMPDADAAAQASGGGDWLAQMADRQAGLLARIAADLARLGGQRGVQAYCLECPASTGTAPAALAARPGALAGPEAAAEPARASWLARALAMMWLR